MTAHLKENKTKHTKKRVCCDYNYHFIFIFTLTTTMNSEEIITNLRNTIEVLQRENLSLAGKGDKLAHENLLLKEDLDTTNARVLVLERSLKQIQEGNKLFLPLTASQLDGLIEEVEVVFDQAQGLHSLVFEREEDPSNKVDTIPKGFGEKFHAIFDGLESMYKKLIGIFDTSPNQGEFVQFWNCLHTKKDEGLIKEIIAPRFKIETSQGSLKTVLWTEIVRNSTLATKNSLFYRDSAQDA